MTTLDLEALKDVFSPEDIEWRLQSSGIKNENVWGLALAYITNRAIMHRLDDVVGPENWSNQFTEGPDGGVLCGISIRIDGEWVTKWDGASNTDIEEVKGGLSGSMKRAAVQWGIGRYLYNLKEGFIREDPNGTHRGKTKEGKTFKWTPPALPDWALPISEGGTAETKHERYLSILKGAAAVQDTHTVVDHYTGAVVSCKEYVRKYWPEARRNFRLAKYMAFMVDIAPKVADTAPKEETAEKDK
jgi:hypothetical protein